MEERDDRCPTEMGQRVLYLGIATCQLQHALGFEPTSVEINAGSTGALTIAAIIAWPTKMFILKYLN